MSGKSRPRHGHALKGKVSPEYRTWIKIKERCHNPNCPQFPEWGGRGIEVCQRWRNSFENFYADMGAKPVGLQIERKDNDGDYEPSNCCWATRREQCNNTRSNVRVTYLGRTQTIAQWAVELNLSADRIYHRIKIGWTPERAFTEPSLTTLFGGNRILEFEGRRMSVDEWAKAVSIPSKTITARLARGGWTLRRILTTPPKHGR